MDLRAELRRILDGTLAELSARRLAREAVGALAPPLGGGGRRVVVLALGKAAADLCAGAADALGPGLAGLAVGPQGAALPAGVARLDGGHPLPDERSLRAGEALLAAAGALGPDDEALVLLSGGGSALAEALPEGMTLEELRAINGALLRAGAPIEEMNQVRGHLSRLKAGGLARALHRAGVGRAVALVLSDVPRGGIRAVSSGPTSPEPTTYAEVLALAARLGVDLPGGARRHLEAGARGERPETLSEHEPAARLVEHRLLADMAAPMERAAGLCPGAVERLPSPVHGPLEAFAALVAGRLAGPPGSALVASGELEVKVPPGAPPGGRDQHLALLLARALRGSPHAFLAAGTDGRDGPTAVAGAIVDGGTWDRALALGLDPERAIAEFGAGPLLTAVGATLPAASTGTHLGDLYVLLRGG